GQTYPSINMAHSSGEIWRLTNASPSVAYDLRLHDTAQDRDMIFQVLSVDGVAVQGSDSTSMKDLQRMAGAKLKPVKCPSTTSVKSAGAICTTQLVMFPSSRIEVWVAYRDATGKLATPPTNDSAIFRTVGFETGPIGDSWPAVDLATVNFGTA